MRTHTFLFTVLTFSLIVTGFVGKAALIQTWTVIFVAGASLALTYLFVTLLTLSEKTREFLLHSEIRRRVVVISSMYASIIGGLAYWTLSAGSVEALPIFPAFLVIFYGWILLQAYFVAAPVTQALARIEHSLSGEKFIQRIVRTLGVSTLFIPAAPLIYGVWLISSWLNGTYQNIQGASISILLWAIGMILALFLTLFLTVSWAWPTIRQGKTQVAVFVGGTYLVVWGYLLYRATSMLIGYLTQSQAGNAALDIVLMAVSIFGAMQTFTRKTMNKGDKRWSQSFPFLVFSFGAIYAVAQLYFIVQIPITRVDLSIFINATILVSGIATMMFLIRKHVFAASPTLQLNETQRSSVDYSATGQSAPSSRLSMLLRNRSKKEEPPPEKNDDY